MIHLGTAAAATLEKFPQQIPDQPDARPIHVIVDRRSIHTSKHILVASKVVSSEFSQNILAVCLSKEGSHLFLGFLQRLASSFQVVTKPFFGLAQLATDPPLDQGP